MLQCEQDATQVSVSVLQCVAVCCSVLQCVTVCHSLLQCAAVCCSVVQYVALCSGATHIDFWWRDDFDIFFAMY